MSRCLCTHTHYTSYRSHVYLFPFSFVFAINSKVWTWFSAIHQSFILGIRKISCLFKRPKVKHDIDAANLLEMHNQTITYIDGLVGSMSGTSAHTTDVSIRYQYAGNLFTSRVTRTHACLRCCNHFKFFNRSRTLHVGQQLSVTRAQHEPQYPIGFF